MYKHSQFPKKCHKSINPIARICNPCFSQMIAKGMTKEEASFMTWTGQRALEKGFNKVIIEKLVPDSPPFITINVKFYK